MNEEYDNKRLLQLKELCGKKAISIQDNELFKIIIKENEMTINKDYLVVLNEQGIIANPIMIDGINKCFEVFISNTSRIIGKEQCQKLYGFSENERIKIAKKEKVINTSIEKKLKEKTVELSDLKKEFARYKADLQVEIRGAAVRRAGVRRAGVRGAGVRGAGARRAIAADGIVGREIVIGVGAGIGEEIGAGEVVRVRVIGEREREIGIGEVVRVIEERATSSKVSGGSMINKPNK